MTTFNTTFQNIFHKYKAAFSVTTTGTPSTIGATLQDHLETGGTFVLNGATPVTVNDLNVKVASAIVISLNTVGGTVGAHPAIQTITANTGFTVAGTAGDTSTYNYLVIG